MSITVYGLLKESGIKFSKADLLIIGVWVRNAYVARFGVQPAKIQQVEDDETFAVFGYPAELKNAIQVIISRYFFRKAKTIHKTLYTKIEPLSLEISPELQYGLDVKERQKQDMINRSGASYKKVGKRKRILKTK